VVTKTDILKGGRWKTPGEKKKRQKRKKEEVIVLPLEKRQKGPKSSQLYSLLTRRGGLDPKRIKDDGDKKGQKERTETSSKWKVSIKDFPQKLLCNTVRESYAKKGENEKRNGRMAA